MQVEDPLPMSPAKPRSHRTASSDRGGEQLDLTAHGQAATSRGLGRLRSAGWTHFDDLRWPGRARAVIDHVAVGPGGIVVITTVHWVGQVGVHGGVVHHNGRPSAAPRACEAAAAAVRLALPPELQGHVVAALAVVTAHNIDAEAGGVIACDAASVDSVLRRRDAVLTSNQVARTAALLASTLSAGTGSLGSSGQFPARRTPWRPPRPGP